MATERNYNTSILTGHVNRLLTKISKLEARVRSLEDKVYGCRVF